MADVPQAPKTSRLSETNYPDSQDSQDSQDRLAQIAHKTEKLDIYFTLLTRAQEQLPFKLSFRSHLIVVETEIDFPFYPKTLAEALRILANQVDAQELVTLVCRTTRCPLGPKELKSLSREALCQTFNVPRPTDESLKKALAAQRAAKDADRNALLAQLRLGAAGVKHFNKWAEQKIPEVSNFRRIDLRGADLSGARFTGLDFQGSRFEGCKMRRVNFYGSDVRGCNFAGADLAHAKFSSVLNGVNFEDASLIGAHFRGSELGHGCFVKTDFSGADFASADLSYANLFAANLSDVKFSRTRFNAYTRWPAGFESHEGLVFQGSGKDPFLRLRIKAMLPAGSVDFEWFINRLAAEFDEKRMDKALKMLKAESFQLFAEVDSEMLVGVVRSQTKADLFYSCYLTDGGSYSCCTQSLLGCGGLRGSLCKHLLVLLIGVTKSGQIDPATACEWVLTSKTKNPYMNKDLMTSTLLRFKGAEAGEIDWRPTETIPEDYYAY